MLTDDDRRRIAEEAVKKAEIQDIIQNKRWYVEARVGSSNYTGHCIRFIDNHGTVNRDVDEVIAELMVERDQMKNRAEQAEQRIHDLENGDYE